MSEIKKIILFLICFLLIIFLVPIKTSSLGQKANNNFSVLVKLKNDPQIYKFNLENSLTVSEVISDYQKNPYVEYAEPNYSVYATAFPNDPEYSKQLYLKDIEAQPAWSKELVAKEVTKQEFETVIAIIDTGVYIDHPDLKDNIWENKDEISGDGIDNDKNGFIDDINGWDFVSNTSDPNPKFEPLYEKRAIHHGTVIAGIAAARGHNNVGITGISWKAKIMPLRALDSQGQGTTYEVWQAINYAISNGADIINMSFVGFNYSQTLYDIIKKAYQKGLIIVAAAGNTDPSLEGFDLEKTSNYPVCYDGENGENFVIGVASVDKNNKKSLFSNYGKKCIDLVAPGEGFYSTQVYNSTIPEFNQDYGGLWSGTSVSAPLVSGAAALIKSLNNKITNQQVAEIIRENTNDISGFNPDYQEKLGSGKLNLLKIVEATLGYKAVEKPIIEGKNYIISGLGFRSIPQLKIQSLEGELIRSYYAYDVNFSGAINVAVGDVNEDKQDEIITGAGLGGGPHIRVFNKYGHSLAQFFAYNSNFRGGVNVAAGDVDGDGRQEVITGAGPGGGPHVRIFNWEGRLLSEFFAYNPSFRGGVKVATGDINGDGVEEIITGAGPGGGPHVRIFNRFGNLLAQFFAYSELFTGGVNVSSCDVNGDRIAEIIVSVSGGTVPNVKIFNPQNLKVLNEFFAYNPNFFGGVNISCGDIDSDGIKEIITGAGPGGGPHVRIFDLSGRLKAQFFSHVPEYRGGTRSVLIRY